MRSTDSPTTWLAEHLRWTRSGVIEATWRITRPLPYGRRPLKDKRTVRDLHGLLVRSLRGEALIQGIAVGVDPVVIVERQIEGIRLSDCPGLADEAEANLDRLSDMVLGERAYYLTVPLAHVGQSRWKAPVKAALGNLQDKVGFPRVRPSDAEIEEALAQAARVEALLPTPFRAHRASVAEQLWIDGHACRRGMVDLAVPTTGSVEESLVLTSATVVPEPVLDEGAWSDDDVLEQKLRNPLSRRVLKVWDPRAAELGQGASYQCPMVLTDVPQGGVVWPGSELFERLDDLAQDVDWSIRLRINSRDDVMATNRKALRELNDQMDQRSDEMAIGTTDLDLAANLLAEYQSIFAVDRLEVEVEHVIILIVAGSTADEAMHRATSLTNQMASSEFKLERPLGALKLLWRASQPGISSMSPLKSWSLHTTGSQFSALVPFTTTRLGGSRGTVWGVNETTARQSIVHLNPGGYPEIDKSGSMVYAGELGAGKSSGMKSVCNGIVDERGQIMVIDKSGDGEWATFAASLTEPVIVDPEDLKWSMDPLRVLGTHDGSQAAVSFVSQLLNLSTNEDTGATAADVLDPAYLAQHHLASLEDVMNHLLTGPDPSSKTRAKATGCGLPGAYELGAALRRSARSRLGKLVLDASLPPVPADAEAIVWRTHVMSQPTAQEIASPHLFRTLAPEKVFGRAYYSLLTTTAKHFAFADRSRVSALVCDEAYDIFANPYNALTLEHFARQGRRPKALLILGSHDPDHDFGDESLRSLIPTRIVLRQTDDRLARASVRYLGIPEDDPEFEATVQELQKDIAPVLEHVDEHGKTDQFVPPERRGECFLRDAVGGVGRARILLPAVPARAVAATTTPPRSRTAT